MKQNKNGISIIIPVLNEAHIIAKLLEHLKVSAQTANILEILVVDGGSKDETVSIAKKNGAKVIHSKKAEPDN